MLNLSRAFFPRQRGYILLGRRLRLQLTLWHLHQLEAAQSPLLGLGDGEIGLGDLVVAASICVTLYPHYLQEPRSPLAAWRHHLAKWRAAKSAPVKVAEMLMWRAYWKASKAAPLQVHRKGSKKCECPTSLALWSTLKLAGFGKAEAWNEPVATAAWYKVGLTEAEGGEVKLMTAARRAAYVAAGRGDLVEAAL